jgi:cytochrome bd-type quinol oxidase subunit 1
MNYPIWELDLIGGPTLVAFVSIIHVYVAQFAVGGGIFLFFLDWWAQRNDDPALLDFVRAHTRFFLLLTMVFGGVTGVGIWFTIGLVNPAATSLLIHEFVFGWAIEWVFFVIEIVALLIYHYAFDRLRPRDRLKIAGIYAFAAWMSLFIIAGIISFMLTPGGWVEDGSFWSGFFNPTLLPSVLFRTCVALSLAGLFALVTAMRGRFEPLRGRLVRIGVAWLLLPVIGLLVGGWWYLQAIPDVLRVRAFELNPEVGVFVSHGVVAAGLLLVLALLMLVVPRGVGRVVVALMLIMGLIATGSFEYLREAARKPWVIPGVMYANGLSPEQVRKAREQGLLSMARWDFTRGLDESNMVPAGRELFNLQCLACHTRGGIYNDIELRIETLTYEGLRAWLEGMGTVRDYMPPFAGTDEERDALAAYLASLHGKPVEAPEPDPLPAQRPADPPERQEPGEYVLLAWNDLGMHCISDCEDRFLILPPANTLEALLIHRADHPTRVTEGVTLSYAVDEKHRKPSQHVAFWDHSQALLGRSIEPDVGVHGLGLVGELEHHDESKAWKAEAIPVVPYASDGSYDPYPLVTVEARDEGGELLASTQVALPTTTEMRCKVCHGGDWRHPQHQAGIGDETARNILALHDRNEGTELYDAAMAGQPVVCQSCHADPAMGTEGQPGVLSFSAALHGWHATTMHLERAQACNACHPSQPDGATRCYRGLHASRGMDCTMCHGELDEHAASLLKGEADDTRAARILVALEPELGTPLEEIEPRRPWVNEPDCLTCHVDYQQPSAYDAFNQWAGGEGLPLFRNRTGAMGLRCEACHGSPHALYPATNHVEQHRDNLQPLRWTGLPFPIGSESRCDTCHTTQWPMSPHHPGMLRPFRGHERRSWVVEEVEQP